MGLQFVSYAIRHMPEAIPQFEVPYFYIHTHTNLGGDFIIFRPNVGGGGGGDINEFWINFVIGNSIFFFQISKFNENWIPDHFPLK